MANKDQETTQHDSNICSFPNAESGRTAIKEQASLWIVRLDRGDLSPQETHELQQWQARSDFHREYLEKLARNWDDMAVMQELATLFPINGVHTTSSLGERLRSGFRYLLRPPVWVASSLAIFGLLAVVMLNQPPHHFQTGIGEQASYTLEDGSTVHLNTNTSLDIDYSDERRVIKLHRGEANFNVAKNPERPFVVYAGEGMVWAVGTAFNVRYIEGQNDQYIDVTVTEGTVKVYAQVEGTTAPALIVDASSGQSRLAAKEALVAAGKSLQYHKVIKSVQPAPAKQLEQKLAWQQGALVFTGQTLEEALQEIARYTDKKLIIADPSIKGIRVGGHYKTNDIDSLLASLSQGFNLSLKQTGNNTIEISARN